MPVDEHLGVAGPLRVTVGPKLDAVALGVQQQVGEVLRGRGVVAVPVRRADDERRSHDHVAVPKGRVVHPHERGRPVVDAYPVELAGLVEVHPGRRPVETDDLEVASHDLLVGVDVGGFALLEPDRLTRIDRYHDDGYQGCRSLLDPVGFCLVGGSVSTPGRTPS